MGYYSRGQVCLNGHKITGDVEGSPEFRESFCAKCGEETITQCLECSSSIRGYYNHDNSGGVVILAIPEFEVPSYCHACGKAFPWTAQKIQTAQELAEEIDELSPAEKAQLKESIPELTTDTVRTEIASLRFRKLMKKAGPVVGKALRDIVVSIATDAAKKSIGF